MKIYGVRKGNANFWWFIHNVFAHPISELFYWLNMRKASDWIHDQTIPIHSENGRG